MQLARLSSNINQKYHQDYSDPVWTDLVTASYYQEQSKSNLIISVGESWTNYHEPRDQVTAEEFWGLDLAEKLDCDWLNIASPGFSNNWMIENLLHYADEINQLPYERINIVVCLTELGRELPDSKVFDYDFINELSPRFEQEGLNAILDFQIEKMVIKLRSLMEQLSDRVTLTIGWNFSDVGQRLQAYPELASILMDKSWIELMATKFDQPVPPEVPVMFVETIEIYRKFLSDNTLFDLSSNKINAWLIDQIDVSDRLLSWFFTCPGIRRPSSNRHPDYNGRLVWVDYLINLLNK